MLELYISKKLESNNRLILFDINYPSYFGSTFDSLWFMDSLTAVSKSSQKKYERRWIYVHRLDEIFYLERGNSCVQTLWNLENVVMTSIMDSPEYIFETKSSGAPYKYPSLTETLLNQSGYYLLIHTSVRDCDIINYLKFDK